MEGAPNGKRSPSSSRNRRAQSQLKSHGSEASLAGFKGRKADEEVKATETLRPARSIHRYGDVDKKQLQKTISEFTEGKVTGQQRNVRVLGRNESLPKIAIYNT